MADSESKKDMQQIGKELVGKAIADKVESGVRLGLGTGSTAKCAIIEIGKKIESGQIKNISGIPTSQATRELAESVGINIITKDALKRDKLDWAFDGADEIVLSSGWAIKGGGGAMTSEKAIAKLSKELILIVDQSKVQEVLGAKWKSVPIEIYQGTEAEVFEDLRGLEAEFYTLRMFDENTVYITEHGNHIIDVVFKAGGIDSYLEKAINASNKSVIENGLFTVPEESLASQVLVARDGEVETININS